MQIFAQSAQKRAAPTEGVLKIEEAIIDNHWASQKEKKLTLDKRFSEQFMRPEEFAAAIGKSIPTLYRWWREGTGPKATKIGGTKAIAREDAAAWMRSQQSEAN